jgi:hypothetical protein
MGCRMYIAGSDDQGKGDGKGDGEGEGDGDGESSVILSNTDSVYYSCSYLCWMKRQLIEMTIALAQRISKPEVVEDLQKWIVPPKPLSILDKIGFGSLFGLDISAAGSETFCKVICDSVSVLDPRILPSTLPPSLASAGLSGVYWFVVHSDCDGEYTPGQCIDIYCWMQMLSKDESVVWVNDSKELFNELFDLFQVAKTKEVGVHVG